MAYLTLTLEILGLTIALLEIRFPIRAKQLERWIDTKEDEIDRMIFSIMKASTWNALVTVCFSILFMIIVPHWVGFWEAIGIDTSHWVWPVGIISTIICGSVVAVAFLSLIGNMISVLNRIGNDHAIGALGLILAMCGTLGELLQMIL